MNPAVRCKKNFPSSRPKNGPDVRFRADFPERKAVPAITSGSCVGVLSIAQLWRTGAIGAPQASSAAQGVHDFDAVARGQGQGGMAAAGHDLAVHFRGHAAAGQAFGLEQPGQGGAGVDGARLSVEDDIHAAIVAPAAA